MQYYRHFFFGIFLPIWMGFFFQSIALADVPPQHSLNILVLADIHFDPFIACHGATPCLLIKKLQEKPVDEWGKILAEYDTDPPKYGKNTNYSLLASTLTESNKLVVTEHVQYVLALGDFLGHSYRKSFEKFSGNENRLAYQLFVKKTLQFLNAEMAKAFPTVDVYMLVGNNDSYQGDYFIKPHGQFLQDTGYLWSRLIKNKTNREAMQQQFSAGGYYAVDLPLYPNVELIMLNTVLFSNLAEGRHIEQAANLELAWLHKRLELVRAQHKKAIIAMHIPPAIDVYALFRLHLFTLMDLWKTNYIKRFQTELDNFSQEISVVLAAHLHADWFHIISYKSSEISVVGMPAISPIFGNNPGFKICYLSPQTFNLINFISFYYPLNYLKKWEIENNFNHMFDRHHSYKKE